MQIYHVKLSTNINQDMTQVFQTHLQLVHKLQTSSIQNQMADFEQAPKKNVLSLSDPHDVG